MKLFEWLFPGKNVEIKKEIEPNEKDVIDKKTTQVVDDLPLGYYNACIDSYSIGRSTGTQEEVIKSLIQRYRKMELIDEVKDSVDKILNEMFVPDTNGRFNVEMDLKECEIPDSIKMKMSKAFDKLLNILNFNKKAKEIGKKWYVDGRIHYNVVVNEDKISKGIEKLAYMDSLDTFLEKQKKKDNVYKYYYKFFNRDENKKYILHPDLVVYVGSGVFDRTDSMNPVEVSNLHAAFKPLNNLKNIEDSFIIYLLIRASEKRKFTVNTGLLGKTAAEEYMRKLVNKFKNELVYNTETGEVNVYKTHHSMVEDFWFSENTQGKGTNVEILEGGKGLADLEIMYYFKDAFYDALKIPESRRNVEKERQMSMFSTNAEIERDEIEFFKMIQGLRNQFSNLFLELLKRELIWTKVLSKNDFDKIKNNILFVYNNDNLYEEMKQSAIFNSRINNLSMVQPFIGKFYTMDDVAYEILKFTEEEWKEKQKDFKKNKDKYDKMNGEDSSFGNEQKNYGNEEESSPLVKDEEEENEEKSKDGTEEE